MKASDNPFTSILIDEEVDPAAPAAGHKRLFIDSADHKLKTIDSSSAVVDYTPGGSGDVATDAIWDAKGDLAGGTGANTAARLAVGTNDYLLVAASGETTGLKWQRFPTFSGARAYHSTTQSVGNSVTPLNMDSEDFDTDTYHDNSTSNSRLTVPATGYYWASAHAQYATTGVVIIGLSINGTAVTGSAVSHPAGDCKLHTSQVVYMTSGQYLEAWAYCATTHNVGDTTYPENRNSVSIFRLA